MGLWFKNKRHKLIVKDASKWKEFLSDIVATGDDKYWDGKKMYQHDHIGDEIAATNEYWTKKIAAGADQRAENAEGISFKKGDSVYFNDPDYPSYKNIVFQIRDLHGEDANLWSDQLPSSGKPFWVKIKNLRKAR
jgi:co-chaperonin GroES (HSP10)